MKAEKMTKKEAQAYLRTISELRAEALPFPAYSKERHALLDASGLLREAASSIAWEQYRYSHGLPEGMNKVIILDYLAE